MGLLQACILDLEDPSLDAVIFRVKLDELVTLRQVHEIPLFEISIVIVAHSFWIELWRDTYLVDIVVDIS